MNVEKVCEICSKSFLVPGARQHTAKTCSQKCRGVLIASRYEKERAKLRCKRCGKEFSSPQCHAPRRKFCSKECADSAFVFNSPMGLAHYAWKGGKAKHQNGYLYMHVEDHPFAGNGYVFEHRLVVEAAMRDLAPTHRFLIKEGDRLYLRPKISVHHINGIKRDNRFANLLACTPAAHRDIHSGAAPMQGEVWPDIEDLKPYEPRRVPCNCEVCGAEFFKKLSDVKRGKGRFYCSRVCYNKRSKTMFDVRFTRKDKRKET